MKKIASFLLMTVVLVSCQTDVTHNDPTFEGYQDGHLWRARYFTAELAANHALTITGVLGYETVTLHTTGNVPGHTYVLGTNNTASYVFAKDDDIREYTTLSADPLVDGQIEITAFDEAKMKVSGTFRFNAAYTGTNPEAEPIINYQYGNFVNVPVIPAL
jgi:hypothetical protein